MTAAPKTERKKKEKKADPEVEAALANLGGALPGPAFVDPPQDNAAAEADKTLEELNSLPPGAPAAHRNRSKPYDYQDHSPLSEAEFGAVGHEMLFARDEVVRLEAAKDQVMSEWKSTIGQAKEKVEDLCRLMKDGRQEIVRVEEVKDFDKLTATVIRLDNGKVLSVRELREDERQRSLLGMDDEHGDGAEKANDLGLEVLDGGAGQAAAEEGADQAGVLGLDQDEEDDSVRDQRALPRVPQLAD